MPKLLSKKSIIIFIIIIIALMAYFTKDLWTDMLVKSTDLSQLTINNISLSKNIADIDLTAFTKNPDFNDKHTKDADCRYFENFLIVYSSSGEIMKLQTLSKSGFSSIASHKFQNLDDVKNKLGNHFANQSYDSAQNLNAIVYYDKINRTKASFVYPNNNKQDQIVVWTILEKY
ncbi:peptidase M56 [Paenibacillus polymyxa]|uniref:peptidase M56 n=1 Tax=Paenibacillus TaxID=44249 RepID=UPI0020B8BA7A|nr:MULTISPECIES: peptidase M56 [Paenibacillus]MCP3805977.1 peptidase M56 [Paenibacillus sp. Lou8.1]MDY7990934.1 peptidase M56 [Paenibacillus polymyxa]MDY8117252.1 peptidase M56 [Paenibacillus polymyxa]